MVADLVALLWAPFLMCLVLTGIHAYLGVHVLAREVVFVDIALAQIAALGATAAFLLGFEMDTWESYVFGLTATIAGALVLSLTRTRARPMAPSRSGRCSSATCWRSGRPRSRRSRHSTRRSASSIGCAVARSS